MRRAIVDTNVWVSAFLTPRGIAAGVYVELLRGSFASVATQETLIELERTLTKYRLMVRYGHDEHDVADFVRDLRRFTEIVAVDVPREVCRGPDDDLLIESAIRGGAHHLVSGDGDLHAAEVVEYLAAYQIEVLTVPEFLAALREDRGAREENGGEEPSDA